MQLNLQSIWQWVKQNGLFLIACFLLIFVAIEAEKFRAQALAAQKAQDQAIADLGKKLGAVQGQLESSGQITSNLSHDLQDIAKQLAAIGASPTQHTGTDVHVGEGTVLNPTGPPIIQPQTGEITGTWSDPHNRFTFHLPSQVFDANQRFKYEAVVFTSKDGKTSLLKDSFAEVDPVTGLVIPEAVVKLDTKFEFVNQKIDPTPIFHLRMLGGIDQTASPILGAELFNLERLDTPVIRNLRWGVLGGYDPKKEVGFFGATMGYRVFGNVALGGYWSINTKAAARLGALVTVELTR